MVKVQAEAELQAAVELHHPKADRLVLAERAEAAPEAAEAVGDTTAVVVETAEQAAEADKALVRLELAAAAEAEAQEA